MSAPNSVAVASSQSRRTLETLTFDNTYARLPEAFYSRLAPTPFRTAALASFNPDAAALLDLDPREAERPDFADYFTGAKPLPGAEPLAMRYAGHQFGTYVPQLGDGRAILLGEVRNAAGESWDLHLKGAGKTPYSRMGDGRAVLRSTIREYLCGEAMHGLGVPTTRALCLIVGDEPVYRETVERGAMLVRLAPSHVRFGSFEFFSHRGEIPHVTRLADYVIERFFPHLVGAESRYAAFLTEVVERTARLMAQWQAVGFAHGVMNTDNMSVLGLTLDYGPFGFLDDYQPGFICNHSDYGGRYAYDQQPSVGFWNLGRLAQALLPLMTKDAALAALQRYQDVCFGEYERLMFAKLGLRERRDGDNSLLAGLLEILDANRVDYTIFFRRLGAFSTRPADENGRLKDMFVNRDDFAGWSEAYTARLASEGSDDEERGRRMNRVNPKYVLRNYLAHNAIEKAEAGDFSEVNRLLDLLKRPFEDRPEMDRYAAPPPEWGKRLEISCSS
jgi:uncharacterized protein YdiU (UPF0061 family)